MSSGDHGEPGSTGSEPAAAAGAAEPPSEIGYARTVTPPAGSPRVETIASRIDRPDSDKLQRAVARARVASKLFAKQPEKVKLGRYHLLEMVGAGGMGVVWGAWDPELDRRVAIKLVKAEMLAARERILIEGQALAKLSHPNVVPVYDVGVVDEQVYLVMEWVRGKNLRAYCKEPRTVREIVAVYRAAGEGLSAAHRVGLIHRDFKPDNAMIGDDGRVRVLDFGLARGEVRPSSEGGDSSEAQVSSDLTRGAGTPRYMPPEQAEGNELTPAVDQYALGVSLREALVGRNADGRDADIPRWLDDIITRATAREAASRFVSMEALLHALARDPTTIWRRRLIALGAVGAAGAAFAIGTLRAGGAELEKCGGGADEIAKVWNATTGDKLTSHLTSLGPYGAEEAKRLVPDMTSYGRRWAATHKRVCMANERKELTPQLYDVRLACLSRAQVALRTVTEILGRADKQRLPNAIVASRALPEVELCVTATSSSSIDPPPSAIKAEVDALSSDVSKIRYLGLAADPTAKALAADLVERAEKLGYLPLVARARLALGFGIIGDGKGAAQAIPEFGHARSAALRAGDIVTFVEAYAREVFALSRTSQQNTIDVTATHALVEDLARGTKNDGAFARTLLLNNLGTHRLAAGDIPGARDYFKRALEEPQLGKRDVELYVVLGNLAIATEDPVERRSLFVEERNHLERELGPNHPFTIINWMRAAAHILDHPVEAANELRDSCTRLTTYHAENQQRIDTCNFELGWLAAERGDVDEMRTAMAALKWPENQYLEVARGYLLLADGKLEEAVRSMETYGNKLAREKGWFDRNVGANAFYVAALAHAKLGHHAQAVARLKTMLEIFDDPGFNKSASYYERRVARTRAALAKLLAKSEPETAKSLANEALAWYREAGGYEGTVAELEAITGSY